MATAYLGLGTNVGNKRGNLVTAAALLAERVGDVLALSDMYETEPWGFESDNTFLNAVIVMTTELSPMELLDATRLIEIEMGRIEKSDGAYHDRIIDIDLLMVDEQILHTERLGLPHPPMHTRIRAPSDAQTVVCNGTVGRSSSVGETSCVWQDDA